MKKSRAGTKDVNPRTCIVTGEAKEPDEMIRFVCDPNGNLVPDLKVDLPGRGVWVSARRIIVRQAIEHELFAKALEQDVEISAALETEVGDLMRRSVMGALAMANKAGVIVFGYSKVNDMIRSGKAALVLHADDAAQDGIRKIGSALKATGIAGESDDEEAPFVTSFATSDELERVLGGLNIMHVSAKSSGAAKNVIKGLNRLQGYLNE